MGNRRAVPNTKERKREKGSERKFHTSMVDYYARNSKSCGAEREYEIRLLSWRRLRVINMEINPYQHIQNMFFFIHFR